MPNRYEKHGPTLVELGYDITPVVGKKPVLKGWSDRPDTAHDCAAHGDKSIGVLLGGKHNLVAVDADVLNPFAANELEKLIDEELGSAPKRIGLSPKFLMVFRCTELMRKWKTGVYEMGDGDAAVEILGEGQQFVASGIHPDTKKKYYWPGDNLTEYKPQDLTEITPDAIRRFLARASSIMSVYGPLKGRVSDRASQPRGGLNLKELTADEGEILAALAHIPNNDEHYDDWVQTAHAIKGALGDDGYDLFCRWSARSNKDDPAQNERLWRSIGKVTSVGAGSIFHWAGEHGFDLQEAREGAFDGPEETKPKHIPEPPSDDLCLTPAQWRARIVPARDFLLGEIFATTTRAFLYAPTGLGKTHFGFAIAMAMATGTRFCHWRARRPARVLIIDGEMPADLVKERLADAERRMIETADNLHVFCNEDAPDMPPLDTPEGQRWIDNLIDKIGGVDFIIFDNLMSLTTGDMKDEESWRPVLGWVKALTRDRTGQLWISHTGHDASHGYGTSTRSWQMDTVMMAKLVEDSGADISFSLSFDAEDGGKARLRKPSNREDYEKTTIKLIDDEWSSSLKVVSTEKTLTRDQVTKVFDVIEKGFAGGNPYSHQSQVKDRNIIPFMVREFGVTKKSAVQYIDEWLAGDSDGEAYLIYETVDKKNKKRGLKMLRRLYV